MIDGILKHEEALKFIFSGKSTFTFLNTKTGNRFTYKSTKHKVDNVYFISILIGTDAYSFIGTIINGEYKHSRRSKIGFKSQSVLTFGYVLDKLKSENLPEFIEIWHSGACGRCGRKLTTPESIKRGFGPECIKLS